jgi:hypothetical protein
MADFTLAQDEQLPTATLTRYRDMDDGTHALVVSADVSAGDAINADIRVGGSAVANVNPVPVADRNPIVCITQTPTVTAGAYSANDVVGGLLTFASAALASGRGGEIVIVDDAGQNVGYNLHLFDRTFTAMSDNGAWNPSDIDMQNYEGFVDIAATDRAAGSNNSGAAKSTGLRCPLPYICSGTSLFGQLETSGTPTYAATDDLTIKLYVRRW